MLPEADVRAQAAEVAAGAFERAPSPSLGLRREGEVGAAKDTEADVNSPPPRQDRLACRLRRPPPATDRARGAPATRAPGRSRLPQVSGSGSLPQLW